MNDRERGRTGGAGESPEGAVEPAREEAEGRPASTTGEGRREAADHAPGAAIPPRTAETGDAPDSRRREPGNPRADDPPERDESLWMLAVSPTIWALHFLLSYVTAAVWCARVGRVGTAFAVPAPLGWVRTAVAIYTAVALVGIGWMLVRGLRAHRLGTSTVPHDFDTPEARHRFLGFATLLLSLLSAVATVYVAMVVLFMETCR